MDTAILNAGQVVCHYLLPDWIQHGLSYGWIFLTMLGIGVVFGIIITILTITDVIHLPLPLQQKALHIILLLVLFGIYPAIFLTRHQLRGRKISLSVAITLIISLLPIFIMILILKYMHWQKCGWVDLF